MIKLNYHELERQLQTVLPSKHSAYQFIKVHYFESDKTFRITWENQGGSSGTIANIQGADVTFHQFTDTDGMQIIMDFVKQDISTQLDLAQSTDINRQQLHVIHKLVDFFALSDRYTRMHSQISDNDLTTIQQFLNDNQTLFEPK